MIVENYFSMSGAIPDASSNLAGQKIVCGRFHPETAWQAGEVCATHRKRYTGPRTWPTRLDPFENVWPLVEQWLNEHPDVTAKSLFHRLQEETPESFGPGQLRILQRRVKEWHSEIARRLVLGADLQSEKEIRAPLAASVRLKMRQFTAGTGFAISLSRA